MFKNIIERANKKPQQKKKVIKKIEDDESGISNKNDTEYHKENIKETSEPVNNENKDLQEEIFANVDNTLNELILPEIPKTKRSKKKREILHRRRIRTKKMKSQLKDKSFISIEIPKKKSSKNTDAENEIESFVAPSLHCENHDAHLSSFAKVLSTIKSNADHKNNMRYNKVSIKVFKEKRK